MEEPYQALALSPSEKALVPIISKSLHLNQQPELIQSQVKHLQRTTASPLFLFHDGSGICTHYRRLRPLGRQVYAIHDPKFLRAAEEDDDPWASLTDMALHYANIIASKAEDCLLGGWSFGGVVAFATARILKAQGRHVKGLILIDSPPPLYHVPLSDCIIHAVTASQSGGDGRAADQMSDSRVSTANVARKLVRRSFRTCAQLLHYFSSACEAQHAENSLEKDTPRLVLLRSQDGWEPPPDSDGVPVEEYANPWLRDRHDRSLATKGWELLTGRLIECVDIPGNHFQVFEPAHIDAVSAALRTACLDLD